MNPIVYKFVEYTRGEMPKHNKQAAEREAQRVFNMTQDGKVFYTNHFAVRFCYSKNASFSNTVLALSKLQKFDHIPFFVVLIRRDEDNKLFLANTSLLKKISHSSRELRVDNIKGSFNGSDIIRTYNEIPNDGEHIDELYAIHQGFSWEENLARLVEATSEIKPIKDKFTPNRIQTCNLFASIERAKEFIESADYDTLKRDLDERVQRNLQAILVASHIENANIRGRLIEYLIRTEDDGILHSLIELESALPVYDTRNGLGDYVRDFPNRRSYTDIKTKIMYLSSNPKPYNVDKFLECMCEDNSVLMFYFVGIDQTGLTNCALCSVYDKRLVAATVLQFHWAGRASRGVSQFNGNALAEILSSKEYHQEIDHTQCRLFLQSLLER